MSAWSRKVLNPQEAGWEVCGGVHYWAGRGRIVTAFARRSLPAQR